jgi:hypothetical protein
MTGYNKAHGDTHAVRMNLDNEEYAYRTYTRLIDRAAWWDDDDSTWNGIDRAARELREFVETELAGSDSPQFGEIRDANLAGVRWDGIVIDYLSQTNLDEGRTADAGGLETSWDS